MKKPEAAQDFLGHLSELRKRILLILAMVTVMSVVGWYVYPLFHSMVIATIGEGLYMTHISEGFSMRFNISILIGILFSMPFALFQIFRFLFPGLSAQEKTWLVGVTLVSTVLLAIGTMYGYEYILPISMVFLKSGEFSPDGVQRMLFYSDFIGFFLQFLLAFGICFQLPVAVLFLVRTGLMTFKSFLKQTRKIIIGIFVIAAIITPPDVFSQLSVALPMLALYFLSLLVAKFIAPRVA